MTDFNLKNTSHVTSKLSCLNEEIFFCECTFFSQLSPFHLWKERGNGKRHGWCGEWQKRVGRITWQTVISVSCASPCCWIESESVILAGRQCCRFWLLCQLKKKKSNSKAAAVPLEYNSRLIKPLCLGQYALSQIHTRPLFLKKTSYNEQTGLFSIIPLQSRKTFIKT